jgi:SAM-dependent methyltransferase
LFTFRGAPREGFVNKNKFVGPISLAFCAGISAGSAALDWEVVVSHPVVQDDQIARLAPSGFSSRGRSEAADEDVREQFFRIYKPLRDGGMHEYHLSRIATALYYYRPLLADLLKPTATKTVLEIGSGQGAKALSWASLFGSYIGIDLNPDDVALGASLLRERGIGNARIICGKADAVLQQPERHGIGRIDLLILYAVLEHLTIPERKLILRLAQDVYLRGGQVMVGESPNRLCRFDQHTWSLSFTDWLPPELVVEHMAASPRDDLKRKVDTSSPERMVESLYRVGRGLSYQEFSCFWDKTPLESLETLCDGYATELLNYYPFMNDEKDLVRYCQDNQIVVPRLFTRYWIEGIFSQNAMRTTTSVRYVAPQEMEVALPRSRRRFWERAARAKAPKTVLNRRYFELDEITISSGSSLLIPAEEMTTAPSQVVLLLESYKSSGRIAVEEIRSGARSVLDLPRLMRGRLPLWHSRVALPLGSTPGVYRIQPEGDGNQLTCLGALLV